MPRDEYDDLSQQRHAEAVVAADVLPTKVWAIFDLSPRKRAAAVVGLPQHWWFYDARI
jgi:hypothetical protein